MKLTTKARQTLDAYVDEVRRSLSGRSDVDAADVVAGIREHVDTELSMCASDPVTAEDVADVLERLGDPIHFAGDAVEPAAHSARGEVRTVLLGLWQVAVLGAVIVVLFAPAGLVWGQAQIGGVLVGPLTEQLGIAGAGRPASYWLAVAAAAALATGLWWLLLSLLVRWHGDAFRRALGVAHWTVPTRASRNLFIAGVVLILASLLGGLL